MQNLNADYPALPAPGESFAPMAGTNGSDTWENFIKRTAGEIIDIVRPRAQDGQAPGNTYLVNTATGGNGEGVLLVIGIVILILIVTSK